MCTFFFFFFESLYPARGPIIIITYRDHVHSVCEVSRIWLAYTSHEFPIVISPRKHLGTIKSRTNLWKKKE